MSNNKVRVSHGLYKASPLFSFLVHEKNEDKAHSCTFMQLVQVSEMSEFLRIGDCPDLNEVNFVGNPIQEQMMEAGTWTSTVSRPQL